MAPSDQPDPRIAAQQLRRPYGEAAAKVGDNMDRVNEPLFDLTYEVMQPSDNQRILEIGFGTGTYMRRLFADTAELEVCGIDYSPDMLETATRTNADLLDAGILRLNIGASDDPPFEDQYFDKVYCNMVVYFWDDPEEHLKEVRRVLRQGGHFYTGMRTKETMLQFPFVHFGFTLFEAEEWMSVLDQHGFEPREAARRLDPVIEGDEGDIRLESVCIEARKR